MALIEPVSRAVTKCAPFMYLDNERGNLTKQNIKLDSRRNSPQAVAPTGVIDSIVCSQSGICSCFQKLLHHLHVILLARHVERAISVLLGLVDGCSPLRSSFTTST